jgi:type VI secretion system protein ImpL
MLAYNLAAAPLVRFLQNQHAALPPAARSTLLRWEKITAQVQAFQNKRPGNSVALLEDYIRGSMNKITPDDLCTAAPLHAQSSDYFLQVRSSIQHDLVQRCQTLSTFDVVKEYGKLAGIFNRELSGRFPFAPPAQAVLGSEADPQSIRDFYALFDADAPLLMQAFTQEQYGASGQSARLFLQQMQTDRGFFTSILGKKNQAALPAVDFTPEFRVNQSREINGNQIQQWTLQVGEDSFRSGDKPRVGRWTYGEPVTLTLQWASNSPLVPFLRSASASVDWSGQALTYHFTDNWALLAMLAAHRAPAGDFAEMADPNPFTLVFEQDEDANKAPASAGGAGDADLARVFLRLTIMPPGQQQSLSGDGFPEVAPPLAAPMNTASNAGGQP